MSNQHFNADRCSSNEFTCWNGTCIPSSEHCDGIRNCTDDSDEIECSKRFCVKKHKVLALMNNLVRCGDSAQQPMQ